MRPTERVCEGIRFTGPRPRRYNIRIFPAIGPPIIWTFQPKATLSKFIMRTSSPRSEVFLQISKSSLERHH